MGKYSTAVADHLVLPARALLTRGQEELLRLAGRTAPAFAPVRMLIDTGSKRSTLSPSIVAHLNPIARGRARVETGLASAETNLYWIRLEFPATALAPIPELAVARLALPASLASFHGVIGRDLLLRWEYVFIEGRRGRLTIRDTAARWLRWFTP
jgi:hypothetical protein